MKFRTHVAIVPLALLGALAACVPTTEPATAPPATDASVVEAPSMPQLPEPYDTKTLRTRSNVRAAASTRADVVGTYAAGTTVGLLDLENGWYQVRIDSTLGWVFAPLVEMNENDRFLAAISYMTPRLTRNDLFTSKYQAEEGLTIILDMGWRDLSEAEKLRVVGETGDAWKAAAERMGIDPPPPIRFMSNNDVEMARWHGFWGPKVFH